jgi:hypothetical protein
MSHIDAASASRPPFYHTFVIRLTWDDYTTTWCIALKSADAKEVRLFPDMESACLYLEAMMRAPQPHQRAERS